MCLALLDNGWIDAETRIIQKQMPVHVTDINRNDLPINEGLYRRFKVKGDLQILGKVVEGS
jgi:hypothetical protein